MAYSVPATIRRACPSLERSTRSLREILHAAGPQRRFPGRAGFTLIEVTLMLAIVSLTAVLALPRSSIGGGTAGLRIKAFEIVALLRADRDEALRRGSAVTSLVDLAAGRVRSGAGNGDVRIPASLAVRISGSFLAGIRFQPDGTASGGEIFLTRPDGSGLLAVRVNPATAAIAIDRSGRDDG